MEGECSAASLFFHSCCSRPLLVSPQVSLSGADHDDDKDSGGDIGDGCDD